MSDEIDLSAVRTYPLAERDSKVQTGLFGSPVAATAGFAEWLESLPEVLGAADLRACAREIARRGAGGGSLVLGMGAHPIKVGLSPLIIDWIESGRIATLALNGAGIIHDFEIAFAGKTSEDVEAQLDDGSFGMAEETGARLNEATVAGVAEGLGLGAAIGRMIAESDAPHADRSVLAACWRKQIPATVHVAVGTDIIHMHPSADGAAIGEASLRDFRRLAGSVARLEGGLYLNLGSAVVLPEVFLKALNLARNTGHVVDDLWTIDMDFLRPYRSSTNVVRRPTRRGGRGIQLTGHHEILFPLLHAAVAVEVEKLRSA